MKINVPSEEEFKDARKKQFRNLGCGFIFGLFLFGLLAHRIIFDFIAFGTEVVPISSILAIVLGVISIAFLAYKFGDEFWDAIFKN